MITAEAAGEALLDVVDERLIPDVPYDQQNDVVLGRLDGQPVAVKVFAQHGLARWHAERVALPLFRSFGLPVATLLDHGRLPSGGAFLVMERLPGGTLVTEGRSGAAMSEAAEQLAALLALQFRHGAVGGAAGRAAARRASAGVKWRRLMARHKRVLTQALGVRETTLRAIGEWADGVPETSRPCWVTTDWRLRHLLWDDAGVSGLLDLEYAQVLDATSETGHLLQDVIVHHRAVDLAAALIATVPPSEHERVRFFVVRRSLEHAAVKHAAGCEHGRLMREASAGVSAFQAGCLDDVPGAVDAG